MLIIPHQSYRYTDLSLTTSISDAIYFTNVRVTELQIYVYQPLVDYSDPIAYLKVRYIISSFWTLEVHYVIIDL